MISLTDVEPKELQARVLALRTLMAGARRSSEILDKFSGWMLAGFGATFAFLLAHIDTVFAFVRLSNLRMGVVLFLLSVIVGVVQKLLASFVASTAASAAEGDAIGRSLVEAGVPVDFAVAFRETEKAVLYPARWIARAVLKKAAAGDFAAIGRMCRMVSQVQGYVVLIQVTLAVSAAIVVAYGLKK